MTPAFKFLSVHRQGHLQCLHSCERRYQRRLDAVQPVPHLVKHAAAVHLGSQPSNRMLPRLDSMSSGRCGRVLSSADELDEGGLPLEQAISMSRGVHALAKPTRRTQLLGSPRAQAGSRTGCDAQGVARSGRRERSTLRCVCSSRLVDASRLFTQTRVTHTSVQSKGAARLFTAADSDRVPRPSIRPSSLICTASWQDTLD